MSVLVVALNGFLTEPTEMLPDTRNPKFSPERLVEEERNCFFLFGVLESSDPPPRLSQAGTVALRGGILVCKESHRLAFPRGGVLSIFENALSKGWRKKDWGSTRLVNKIGGCARSEPGS